MAVACVIGNPAAGSGQFLSLVRDDVAAVLHFLASKNIPVTNRGSTLCLKSDQMRDVFSAFVDVCRETDGPYYFYFCGHAFEHDDDIHLVGEEVDDVDTFPVLQSLRLKDCLVSLAPLTGLKIVVVDACRINPSGDDDEEGFEWQSEALLQNMLDLVLITSASAGRAAYDGQFTRRLIDRLNRLGEVHLPLPLQNWLDAVMSDLSAELGEAQRPALSQVQFTQDWTLGDVVAGRNTDEISVSETSIGRLAHTSNTEQGQSMTLKRLDRDEISAYLTEIREKSLGNITGYFLFSNGELEAADYGAYRDDTTGRLSPGYAIVEAAAVRSACSALEPAGRVMSREESGHFGDLRAIIFGFSKTIITMTVPEPAVHLVALFHPKERYHYRMATNSQEDFLSLVKARKPTTYPEEKRRALRESGELDLQQKLENPDPIPLEKLLRPTPETLSALMSQSSADDGRVAYSSAADGVYRGFVLLAQDETREKRKTIRSISSCIGGLQSHQKKGEAHYVYREECKPLASKDFANGILDVLVNEQLMIRKAGDVGAITGALRTFWFSFNKAVIGVNPFDDVRDGKRIGQYFLLSVYGGKSQADVKFNYGGARQLIRLLCDDAG